MTPGEYITNAKMQYAAELLKQPEMNISKAAILSGYSNYCYFTKVFKKYTGVSPGEYIRTNGKNQFKN